MAWATTPSEDNTMDVTLYCNGVGDAVNVQFYIKGDERDFQDILQHPDNPSQVETTRRSYSMLGENSYEEEKRGIEHNQIRTSQSFHNEEPQHQDNYFVELFKAIVDKITVIALPCTSMPSGLNMIKMLNISKTFKKFGYVQEYYESLFLTGLTMVSSRKYVQSVEFFRQIQKNIFHTLHGIQNEVSMIDKNEVNPYKINPDFVLEQEAIQSQTNKSIDFRRLLRKAAKLEILIADCCSQHSQVKEKLDAFHDATLLYKIKTLDDFKRDVPPKSYMSLNTPIS